MTGHPDPVIESSLLLNARIGVKTQYTVPVVSAFELATAADHIGYKMVVDAANNEICKGSKTNSQIYVDHTKGIFGIIGKDIEFVIEDTKRFFEIANDMYGIHLEDYVDFYESEMNSIYNTNTDVYVAMSKLFNDSSDLKNISKILGGRYSQFSISLTTATQNINSKDWHEIIIAPKIVGNGKSFTSKMVRRNPTFEVVTAAAKEAQKKIFSIIHIVIMKSKS